MVRSTFFLLLSTVTLTLAFHPPLLPSKKNPRPYAYGALSVRRHTRSTATNTRNSVPATNTNSNSINDNPAQQQEKIPEEMQSLMDSLKAVQALPRIREAGEEKDYNNGLFVICPETKPTFRRLFTHETWKIHVGGSTLSRWIRCMSTTPSSVILRAVSKTVLFLSVWAGVVSHFLPKYFALKAVKDQSLPLSLCGNAIGLLLVFRTNHAYNRLEEARELMEKVIHLSGEIVSTFVSAWQPYGDVSAKNEKLNFSVRTSAVALVCRHLAAFSWSLRDELRDGDTRDDVLRLLLPPKEAAWVASQRSRTLAIHGALRRILYQECAQGHLPDQLQFILEGNLKQLSAVATSCERLFTSPIPPTMSRHGLRSMTLWMMALPIVMAVNKISPVVNVAWTAAISFIYLGIDELGVQVEQPFRVIPMWQLCQLAQEDILEFALHPLDLY